MEVQILNRSEYVQNYHDYDKVEIPFLGRVDRLPVILGNVKTDTVLVNARLVSSVASNFWEEFYKELNVKEVSVVIFHNNAYASQHVEIAEKYGITLFVKGTQE